MPTAPTARARPDARRDYRHFPPAYAEILHKFKGKGVASIGPCNEREAQAARRDLYRYKTFLSAALEADADDEQAHELYQIFNRVVLRIEPVEDPTDGRTHRLTLYINPIVAAVEGG